MAAAAAVVPNKTPRRPRLILLAVPLVSPNDAFLLSHNETASDVVRRDAFVEYAAIGWDGAKLDGVRRWQFIFSRTARA